MNWRVKGVLQKALSIVPGGRHVNNVLQQRLGGLRDFESDVRSKVHDDWLVLVSHMRELAFPIAGRTFLEIGTGWYPTLPVCFSLAGAAKCLTYDLTRLLDFRLTQRMLACFETHLPAIAAAADVDEKIVRERWVAMAGAGDLADLLGSSSLDYRAPANASATGLPAASVDVVFSNSVLEHVTRDELDPLMAETRRVLRPGGIAIHSVNCGDHYAYFDRAITQINYLRYDEAKWRFWNNGLQYQNRLRANEFVEAARRAGLQIVLDRQRPRPELLELFDSFPIARQFKQYTPEQLCTTSVDFVAKAEV